MSGFSDVLLFQEVVSEFRLAAAWWMTMTTQLPG